MEVSNIYELCIENQKVELTEKQCDELMNKLIDEIATRMITKLTSRELNFGVVLKEGSDTSAILQQ